MAPQDIEPFTELVWEQMRCSNVVHPNRRDTHALSGRVPDAAGLSAVVAEKTADGLCFPAGVFAPGKLEACACRPMKAASAASFPARVSNSTRCRDNSAVAARSISGEIASASTEPAGPTRCLPAGSSGRRGTPDGSLSARSGASSRRMRLSIAKSSICFASLSAYGLSDFGGGV